MKALLNKYYKIIVSVCSFAVNSTGLALSILSASSSSSFAQSQTFITSLLIVAELFLVVSVIYTFISFFKDLNNKVSFEKKEYELTLCKNANKIIYEDYKASITTYKDFSNRLNLLETKYLSKKANHATVQKEIIDALQNSNASSTQIEEQLNKSILEEREQLKADLLDLYNRFIINIINLLTESITEYLQTKECYVQVSIALKQLENPQNYSAIDEKISDIHTAFRDSKTYRSKTRNETWQKSFCIRKNSDFVCSIEKDYYIFNFIDKSFMENGLYLNENSNFYENYNSGVTCSINSCIGKEKILYGFLACDSLFTKKERDKCGKNIYDYNVANMMMSAAHIIAMFLSQFLSVWEKHYIASFCDPSDKEKYATAKKKYGLCNVMIERVNNSRFSN